MLVTVTARREVDAEIVGENPRRTRRRFQRGRADDVRPARAALVFETSGTTAGAPGNISSKRRLYDAALLAGFDRFVLADGPRLRYFNLVPNPGEARTRRWDT